MSINVNLANAERCKHSAMPFLQRKLNENSIVLKALSEIWSLIGQYSLNFPLIGHYISGGRGAGQPAVSPPQVQPSLCRLQQVRDLIG